MTHIETRQNRKGNFWCNGTINGYDISFEEQTTEKAREKMGEYLENRNISNVIWEAVKYYPATDNVKLNKYSVGYRASRIDNKPFA